MFENSGSKLKVWAQIVFWIGAIASFVTGIMCGNAAGMAYGYYSSSSHFSFGTFLLIVVLGVLSSYISALAIYGLGEAADSAASAQVVGHANSAKLDRLENKLNRLVSELEEANKQKENRNTAEEKAEKPGAVSIVKPVVKPEEPKSEEPAKPHTIKW